MIVKEKGKYVLLKDLTIRDTIRIGTTPKGTIVEITQIDKTYNKVIGPNFYDWIHWDLPVRKL